MRIIPSTTWVSSEISTPLYFHTYVNPGFAAASEMSSGIERVPSSMVLISTLSPNTKTTLPVSGWGASGALAAQKWMALVASMCSFLIT